MTLQCFFFLTRFQCTNSLLGYSTTKNSATYKTFNTLHVSLPLNIIILVYTFQTNELLASGLQTYICTLKRIVSFIKMIIYTFMFILWMDCIMLVLLALCLKLVILITMELRKNKTNSSLTIIWKRETPEHYGLGFAVLKSNRTLIYLPKCFL